MKHPFQRLLVCSNQIPSPNRCLLAAAGPSIYSFSLEDGRLLSTWSQEHPNKVPDNLNKSGGEGAAERDVPSSPKQEHEEAIGQKRKLSQHFHSTEDNATEERPSKSTKTSPTLSAPDVIRLISTNSGRHVVAVTGHDKCIRVFELQSYGVLKLLSERCMAKRPSAIVITSDDETIFCADKFGDVYSIPLLISQPNLVLRNALALEKEGLDAPKKAFVPAATHLTVHTARNQRTLEEQLKGSNQVSKKTGLPFEHQLLLGHVSMLTDITHVTLEGVHAPQGKRRNYIITSDRDEHIRISRGQPQAHVIENYCLGHTDFVSKICVPSWKPTLLISGGGDDYLMVWDWVHGRVVQKVYLTAAVDSPYAAKVENGTNADDSTLGVDDTETTFGGNTSALPRTESHRKSKQRHDGAQIAVSGIWTISHPDHSEKNEKSRTRAREGELLVTCESIPAVFCFDISSGGELRFRETLTLAGNPLDIAISEATSSIIITIDNVHESGTTSISRSTQEHGSFQSFVRRSETEHGSWVESSEGMRAMNLQGSFEMTDVQKKALPDLLYGVSNLRKRGNDEHSSS